MARDPRLALIDWEQLLFRIQGLMMHSHRLQPAIPEGLNQSLPIPWSTQGRHHPPSLIGWVQSAAVCHQMPPADTGRRGIWMGVKEGDGFCGGEIHQPQAHARMGSVQAEQGLQGKGFTQGWVHGPSRSQGLHPFANKSLLG
jgi:hypothetical protein